MGMERHSQVPCHADPGQSPGDQFGSPGPIVGRSLQSCVSPECCGPDGFLPHYDSPVPISSQADLITSGPEFQEEQGQGVQYHPFG